MAPSMQEKFLLENVACFRGILCIRGPVSASSKRFGHLAVRLQSRLIIG